MKKTIQSISICLILTVLITVLVGCGTRSMTLQEALIDNPSALDILRTQRDELVYKDYTVYSTGGGMLDNINATRYATGLVETHERFVTYEYVVEDNDSGWLYIFESLRDIPKWVETSYTN